MIQKSFVLALLALLFSSACGYTDSLADCQDFASKFDNTCDSDGAVVSCDRETTNIEVCGGTWDGTTCNFTRKLCVTCSDKNGTTYINVTGNGLPNHCVGGPNTYVENEVSFEVKWNWAVADNSTTTEAETQDELNGELCDIRWPEDSGIPAAADYTLTEGAVSTMTAVALDGGYIFSPLSLEDVDPFWPTVYGSVTDPDSAKEQVDLCIMHPEGDGYLHYHMMSPCILEPDTYGRSVGPCTDDSECGTEKVSWALGGYENYKQLTPLGIAKDGHVLWGPYKADGTVWADCDVDMCGGAVIEGSYGYATTIFHPYFVGCWGRGSATQLTPACTANGRSCVSSANDIIAATTFGVLVVMAAQYF